MIQTLISAIRRFFFLPDDTPSIEPLDKRSRQFLNNTVSFYRALTDEEKLTFEKRALLFLHTTQVIGHDVEITDEDCLLIASAAIILVWKFPRWHYVNLDTVYLVSGAFNDQADLGKHDSHNLGVVGNGALYGKMILSKPALHYGFSNDQDKHNVALHEFAHLLDMADGDADGFPERMKAFAFSAPWINLVRQETQKIHEQKSNINPYASTNHVEFFAVATEYFFEQPKHLKHTHPDIYQHLESFYQHDVAAIETSILPRKKSPCPCGSGKRYKRCCLIKLD